jgi:hypothetical protein
MNLRLEPSLIMSVSDSPLDTIIKRAVLIAPLNVTDEKFYPGINRMGENLKRFDRFIKRCSTKPLRICFGSS